VSQNNELTGDFKWIKPLNGPCGRLTAEHRQATERFAVRQTMGKSSSPFFACVV
jgi:hypothetical protein